MGLFSSRGKAGSLVSKALNFVGSNPDKVNNNVAKAGDFVNKKTHGKYSRHITGAQSKATAAVARLNRKNGRNPHDGSGPDTGQTT
ncbi:antitoxin [Arthrobacter echini]|uniref:Antitoxin n=1 Tax=Arthrobacter echini TaxID=1529066 RepID=A0A5D0XJ90_9MICC|nr:antitoxin [Arthrobacter echini]TYC96635.1 antitoxin [Arthrobacter echini]